MAIGTISSPATWNVGTVVAPTWCQNVQDTVNFMYPRTVIAVGAVNSGTLTFYSQRNGASVSKIGTGHFTVNLTSGGTSAANMVVLVTSIAQGFASGGAGTPTALDIHTYNTSGVATDGDFSFAVFDDGVT